MSDLSPEQHHDIDEIAEVLRFLESFFGYLVHESGVIQIEFRDQFSGVLEIVLVRLQKASGDLKEIEDDDNEVWKGLDNAGLTGPPLQLKLTLGRSMFNQTQPQTPGPAPRGFKAKLLEPFFRWTNSFLGSLARAVPGLELVKEYKDGVEMALDHQAEGNPPPPSIF